MKPLNQPALLLAALLAVPAHSWAVVASFTNTNTISINDSTSPPTLASPYPSTITVGGLGGQAITKATVALNGLTHEFPSDIDMLLVGPGGQATFLISKVGGSEKFSVTNLTITLDDDAASPLPIDTALVSGTFRPTMQFSPLNFNLPAPAPAGNSSAVATLSVFNGTDPDGTWNLFVVDDTSSDAGVISGGWSLTISTTVSSAPVPVQLAIARAGGGNVVLSWTNAATGYTLQTTPSLKAPVTWTNAVPVPTQVAGQFMVTNAVAGGPRFYRLAQ
jgi:subtilisin-like proprotein convertase family protein